jgi:hypothetical protein
MMALAIGFRGYAMRHEISLISPRYGQASIVLLAWESSPSLGAYVKFDRPGFNRIDALQQGAELMAWVDSMVSDSPLPVPFDWIVISSDLDGLDGGCDV